MEEMKIEIVDFKEMEFKDIPQQDNPAFMPKSEWAEIGVDRVIMICKLMILYKEDL